MQYFDFSYFRNKGIKCGVTIHNIPPAECGTSWKGDFFFSYLKDEVRKLGVQIINRHRIRHQEFDYYVVPSQHVKNLLQPVLPGADIHVISHGIDTKIERTQPHSQKKTLQVLCVAGFVPHKRQDVLVDVAAILLKKGFHIHWILVGPVRNKPYFQYITDKLSKTKKLSFDIRESVSEEALRELYLTTDIYVQPSSEEGFCLTALDAASYGLPIVATSTGALPEIIRAGSGIVSDTDTSSIAEAIQKVILSMDDFSLQAFQRITAVRSQFNWIESAKKLKMIIEVNK
jgi:glycosyltransferase involved in cell wall biosynthesis